MNNKSTTEEIKDRFDKDVERFSNLDTGQVSTVDAAISLEVITESAKRIKPDARDLLDIGAGAGNYTLKMLSKIPNLNCTLVDLSLPMLNRSRERVGKVTSGNITCLQGDIREVSLDENKYDIILAGAVLHHLRDDSDWEFVFHKLYSVIKKVDVL
ncbi:MAG: class I SAM-dependent methyltransferase [Bacteroides sp.]|nr:class I SAM-dependent methyltransferase [Bacteroides sp.]